MRNLSSYLFFSFSMNLLQAQETSLLRDPDISDTKVVLAYAIDLWTVDKAGGVASGLQVFRELKQIQGFLLMEKQLHSLANTRKY